MREGSKKVLSRLPGAWEIARRTEEYAKGMLVPASLFEELRLELHRLITATTADPGGYPAQHARHEGPAVPPCGDQERQGRPGPYELDPIGYHAITKLEAPGSAPKKTGGNLADR